MKHSIHTFKLTVINLKWQEINLRQELNLIPNTNFTC